MRSPGQPVGRDIRNGEYNPQLVKHSFYVLMPHLELKGELEELIDLQTRAEEWRDARFAANCPRILQG